VPRYFPLRLHRNFRCRRSSPAASDKASERFLEFFAATTRSKNTRGQYAAGVSKMAYGWRMAHLFSHEDLQDTIVAVDEEQHSLDGHVSLFSPVRQRDYNVLVMRQEPPKLVLTAANRAGIWCCAR